MQHLKKKRRIHGLNNFLLIGKHTKQLCHLISLVYMALDMRKPVVGVSKSNSNHFFYQDAQHLRVASG